MKISIPTFNQATREKAENWLSRVFLLVPKAPLAVALCMLINLAAPFAQALNSTDNAFSKVFQTKQALFQLGTACSLPVTEVGRLVGEESPLASQINHTSSRDGNNAAADFINGFSSKTVVVKKVIETRLSSFDRVDLDSTYLYPAGFSMLISPPGGGSFVFLLFLMYLVILMKSSLPWEQVCVRVTRE
jgi:hypothetical protein